MQFWIFPLMELLVFRHGPAGDKKEWMAAGRDDSLRPLTKDGRDKTRKAAAGLSRLLDGLDVIAASPLKRAAQTADELTPYFESAKRITLPSSSPKPPPPRPPPASWACGPGERPSSATSRS